MRQGERAINFILYTYQNDDNRNQRGKCFLSAAQGDQKSRNKYPEVNK
jgi:hypothetical protein